MATIHGRCHCGNLQATLTTAKQPEEMWLRACQCDFCRSHNMRSLSDPDGRMELRVRDGSQVNRYHFGLGMVDFLICRNCGNYIGAVQAVDGRLYGIMNANLTDGRGARFGEAEHRFYEDETGAERSARRRKVWTPAVLLVEGEGGA
ncbi:MAG: aldehyde-activating protein [Alphaproteobacteria bacterium]|nr:aldehyde-activating protein [Alphaproteobacteria bacterium]MCB9930429.1 aldehyde-activating protein [Alphaproteobacteria bacterium]